MKPILVFALSLVCFFGAYGQDKKEMKPELTPLQSLTDDGITGEVKDRIVRHLKSNLPRQTVEFILSNDEEGEKDLIVSETDSAPFAETVKFYSLRHRSFLHWAETYVEFDGEFFTSLKKDDFENFLKDYDFLNKPDSLNLFVAAYKNFNMNDSAVHPEYIVTDDYLKKNQEDLNKYEAGKPKLSYKNIHSPKRTKNEISFFVASPLLNKITYRKVSVSPSYSFQWNSKTYCQENIVRASKRVE